MGTHAGKYDKLLSIYKPTLTKSGTGQQTKVFELYVDEVPCQEEPRGGNISVESDQRVANTTSVFRIRFPHSFDVLETYEVGFRGQMYRINLIQESKNGREVELEIFATKKDNQ